MIFGDESRQGFFCCYLAVFLALHAALPFLSLAKPATLKEKIISWAFKIFCPLMSIFGWSILGVVLFKVGLKYGLIVRAAFCPRTLRKRKFLLFAHGTDALVTRYIAKKGIYPA